MIIDTSVIVASFEMNQRRSLPNFGKGSGHPAKLNFSDCFAYALAKESGEPLLFKGGDFAHTDIVFALPADR
jgi:ribonuclease VapC